MLLTFLVLPFCVSVHFTLSSSPNFKTEPHIFRHFYLAKVVINHERVQNKFIPYVAPLFSVSIIHGTSDAEHDQYTNTLPRSRLTYFFIFTRRLCGQTPCLLFDIPLLVFYHTRTEIVTLFISLLLTSHRTAIIIIYRKNTPLHERYD